MTTAQTVLVVMVVILAVAVVLALVVSAQRARRRRALQQRFGPEYDRLVSDRDSRTAAERELVEREQRHSQLEIKPLAPESRERFEASWRQTQVRFVDAPSEAVGEADRLVTELAAERGYPTDDFDERVATLSVDHAATLDRYRSAHDIAAKNDRNEATTEELRQAMVHYRALFTDLLGADRGQARHASDR